MDSVMKKGKFSFRKSGRCDFRQASISSMQTVQRDTGTCRIASMNCLDIMAFSCWEQTGGAVWAGAL